jgi:hypothetical protein
METEDPNVDQDQLEDEEVRMKKAEGRNCCCCYTCVFRMQRILSRSSFRT